MQKQTWTIKDIIAWTCDYFKEKNVDAPRITSELLLGNVLNLSRINLYVNYDKPLLDEELARFKALIQRRSRGEPVQYIIGHQEFWSLDFTVTPDVLIPRADTETLVEAVINDIVKNDKRDINILDIGTGSGAISVAVAHELKSRSVRITASDISDSALKIAKMNAEKNGVGGIINFILSDMFDNIPEEKFDYILSNPPYIAKEHFDALEKKVKDFEPRGALYGGDDGMLFYNQIISNADRYLSDDGKMFLEIDFRTIDALLNLIDKKKYTNILFYKDLPGHDRVIQMQIRG